MTSCSSGSEDEKFFLTARDEDRTVSQIVAHRPAPVSEALPFPSSTLAPGPGETAGRAESGPVALFGPAVRACLLLCAM